MMTRSKTQALTLLDEIDVNRVREFPPETVNVNATDENMDTRLHIAAQNFTSDAINNLKNKFVEISVYTKYPDASKILEIIKMWIRGGADIVDVLLRRGASVNAKNKYECTPLHNATVATTRVFDIIDGFRSIWPNIDWMRHFENSVAETVDETAIRIVELLLSNGADANASDEQRITPLYQAAACNKPSIVKLLLDHGADINVKTASGLTPLHRAVILGSTSSVKILLEYGADAKIKDIYNRAPQHYLSHSTLPTEFRDILNLLLQYGADLESRCRGQTLAHLIVHGIFYNPIRQKKNCYELLLNMVNEVFSHGADVSATDNNGETPYTNLRKNLSCLCHCQYKLEYLLFQNHIEKLVALGAIHMAEKNRPLFFDIMNASIEKQISLMQKPHQINPRDPGDGHDYYGKCVHEVNILKTFQLSQNITLADVLTLENPMKLANVTRIIVFEEYAKSVDLDNKFPIYAFVINHQYERGLEMKLLCEKCEISLKIISSGKLNRDCAQEVLQHLSAIELKNLSET